jgi:ABC-2 type transport system ATP-binding protein
LPRIFSSDVAHGIRNRRRRSEKTYRPKGRKGVEVKALDGISFEVPRGEFFGLLGPNGAGKTTTIGILTTRVVPTGGVAKIEGVDVAHDPVTVKHRIGVVPQVNNLDRSLTAKEILVFHAEYFGIPKQEREQHADDLLSRFELTERGGRKGEWFFRRHGAAPEDSRAL